MTSPSPSPSRGSPFFFHTAAEPLFGIYHPPAASRSPEQGVVLCAPVGHEYQRTHWCFRLLADDLCRAGLHVLRFDYSGTGDSWGAFEQATAERWIDDIRVAIVELRDTSGVERVSLVGLRVGAALARAAANGEEVHRIIEWEPVAGLAFVESLRRMRTPGPDAEALFGFRYRPTLTDGLRRLSTEPSVIVANADGEDWNNAERFAEPILLPAGRRRVVELLTEAMS